MRKLFWSCVAGGVIILGGSFTLAGVAVRHPESVIGRFMHGVGKAASQVNPYAGVMPVLAQVEVSPREVCCIHGEEGDEGEQEATPRPITPPPAIVIVDDEQPSATQIVNLDLLSPPPIKGVPAHFEGECPPGAIAQITPMIMPLCQEEECEISSVTRIVTTGIAQGEQMHMPRLVEATEVLPMPREEEEQEAELETSCPGDKCTHGGVDQLFRLFQKSLHKHTEMPAQENPIPECREDVNHHRHYPGCPATCPSGACPGMYAPRHATPVEPIKPASSGDGFQQWIPKKASGTTPAIETMEQRKSDLPATGGIEPPF